MKITKIRIKNLFGISEYEADGANRELAGRNGVGKSSVIDAIKYALSNKSDRKYIVRNGETEGEVLIETDTGLRINRKARTNQVDYKSVKQDGREGRFSRNCSSIQWSFWKCPRSSRMQSSWT